MLLITLLIGLACAAYEQQEQSNQNRPAHRNHRRVHRRPTILALDQLIKKKHASHFLGRHFVAKALTSQKGNKFLKLSGKEQRDINGSIKSNKTNTIVELNESKSGHFLVQNRKQQVVGRVDMFSGNRKHLTIERQKNGDQTIQGYHSGSGSISLEKDMIRGGRFGPAKAAKKHLKMTVSQGHYTQGNVEIYDIKARQEREQQQQQQQEQEQEQEHEQTRNRRSVVAPEMPVDAGLKAVQE